MATPGITKVTTKTGDTRYEVRFETTHQGKRRIIKRRARTLKDAKAVQAALRVASEDGSLFTEAPARALTVRVLVDGYLAEVRPTVQPVTFNGYRGHAAHVIDALGDRDAATVTRDDVVEVRNTWLESGLSPLVVGRNLRVLRAAYQRAVDDDLLPRNPALKVKPPTYDPAPRRFWSQEDTATFLAVAEADRLGALWLLSLRGLRRSEVLGLQWGDVDYVAGMVAVRRGRVLASWGEVSVSPLKTKNSRRDVPVGDRVVRALAAMAEAREVEVAALGGVVSDTDWLAVDEAGNPLHPDAYSKRWRVLCTEAGVPVIELREARTTAATLLRERGAATDVAAEYLGHDPVVYERVYVQTSRERLRVAGDALDL